MDPSIELRPYRKEDLPRIESLEARIQPYRPEDELQVKAMYTRALNAQKSNDPRWMDFPTPKARTSTVPKTGLPRSQIFIYRSVRIGLAGAKALTRA